MAKPAEVLEVAQNRHLLPDEGIDGDSLFLRQRKEEEIRAKLNAFARELAAAAEVRRARGKSS